MVVVVRWICNKTYQCHFMWCHVYSPLEPSPLLNQCHYIWSQSIDRYVLLSTSCHVNIISCYYREKSRSQYSTFWHIREKHGFHFLMRKLRISLGRMGPPMKLIGYVNMTILFHLAPSRMLYKKYFSSYEFFLLFLGKIKIWFYFIFYNFV